MRLTGDRRVATIATILVCVGGGLGWIRLVGDLMAGAGDAVDLVSRISYDNTWADGWPYFKIASIFGTGFLPHRATTLGLPGLVTVVLLVVDAASVAGRSGSCWRGSSPRCWRRSSSSPSRRPT